MKANDFAKSREIAISFQKALSAPFELSMDSWDSVDRDFEIEAPTLSNSVFFRQIHETVCQSNSGVASTPRARTLRLRGREFIQASPCPITPAKPAIGAHENIVPHDGVETQSQALRCLCSSYTRKEAKAPMTRETAYESRRKSHRAQSGEAPLPA
jgi:hypothetical protein